MKRRYIKDICHGKIIGTPDYNKENYCIKRIGQDGNYEIILKISNSKECDKVVEYLNKIDGYDKREQYVYDISEKVKEKLINIIEDITEEVLEE